MTDSARSVRGVRIRLTSERWLHIVEHHDDLAGHYHDVLATVSTRDAVYEGDGGELLAISRRFAPRCLVVAYRELTSSDGFVITAFFTTRVRQVERRRLLWTKA